MTLDEYPGQAFAFSRINWEDARERHIASLGLVGELGSLAAEVKKGIREGEAYTDFMLRNAKRIDRNILTLISRMVQGLKTDKLPLHEWQKAFFVSFNAFTRLHEDKGGWLLLNADARSLTFSKT